jgi:transcriptional regulator with XRE-family HTH domain
MKKMNPEDPKVIFGQTIRGIRKLKRLTQDKLSELSGKAPVYISTLERGQVNPTLDTILIFAEALGVEPADFFALAFSTESEFKKDMKKQFIAMLSKSTDDELKIVMKIINAVVKK